MWRSPCTRAHTHTPLKQGGQPHPSPRGPLLGAPTPRLCAALRGSPPTWRWIPPGAGPSAHPPASASSCLCPPLRLRMESPPAAIVPAKPWTGGSRRWGQGQVGVWVRVTSALLLSQPHIRWGLGPVGTAAPSRPSAKARLLGGSPTPGTFRCCSCRRSSSSCRRLFSISACFFRFS